MSLFPTQQGFLHQNPKQHNLNPTLVPLLSISKNLCNKEKNAQTILKDIRHAAQRDHARQC